MLSLWPPLSKLVGVSERNADAIVLNRTVRNKLQLYGQFGGWDICFHSDPTQYCLASTKYSLLFVDSLDVLEGIGESRGSQVRVYLLGPDRKELAEQAEEHGVVALLTCPDEWFDPL